MTSKIQKWGNSQGLRFPKDILKKARIMVGDCVSIDVKNFQIVIKPIKKVRRKYNLKTLLSNMPDVYKKGEEDWGKPVGKEVW